MQSICDNIILKGLIPGVQEDVEGIKQVVLNHHDVVKEHILKGKHQRYSAVLSYLSRYLNGEKGRPHTNNSLNITTELPTIPKIEIPITDLNGDNGSVTSSGPACTCSDDGEKCAACALQTSQEQEKGIVKVAEIAPGIQVVIPSDQQEGEVIVGGGTSPANSVKQGSSSGSGVTRWAQENTRLQRRMEELEARCDAMEASRKYEAELKERALQQLKLLHVEVSRLQAQVENTGANTHAPFTGMEVGVPGYLGSHEKVKMLEVQITAARKQCLLLQRSHLQALKQLIGEGEDDGVNGIGWAQAAVCSSSSDGSSASVMDMPPVF